MPSARDASSAANIASVGVTPADVAPMACVTFFTTLCPDRTFG